MAKVRTGKTTLGKIWSLIEERENRYSIENPVSEDIFPRGWNLTPFKEVVALECIENKGIVITVISSGASHLVELDNSEYYAEKLWGELWDKQMKLFTDVDLDGYGCGVVATAMFGKLNVDIEHLRYNTLFDRLKEFFSDHDLHKQFYKVYMTDLNITEEQYLELKELADPTFDWNNRFVMIDHHVTSLPMNKYKFAHVVHEREDGFKPCGTSLFYEYCENDIQYQVDRKVRMDKFVEQVRQWDVWDWAITGDTQPPKLNKLSELYSIEEFIELMVERLSRENPVIITEEEEFYLKMKQKEMESYFRRKEKTIKEVEFEGHKIGLVFGEQFRSELGNHLSETFPQYDAIMLMGMSGGVSFRTAHDHVDCSAIAKRLGGGGHPKASGFPMENIKDWVAQHIEDRDWNE